MISLTKNWMIFMMLLGTSVFAKSQSQIPEIYSFGKTSIDFDLGDRCGATTIYGFAATVFSKGR